MSNLDFFRNIGLVNTNQINTDPKYKKIDDLYSSITQGVNEYFTKKIVLNPPQIVGNDNVVMWYDPSNIDLMNLGANNQLTNNANGVCLFDKSNYSNHLSLVATGSGVIYNPYKNMIGFLGENILSVLNTTTLSPASFWNGLEATKGFSYFIVVEEEDRANADIRQLLSFFYTTPAGNETRCDLSSGANEREYYFNNGVNINLSTQVAHPNIDNFNNIQGKVILGFVYGFTPDFNTPYRDLYWNGIFCGRQQNFTGLDIRNRTFVLGSHSTGANITNFSGYIGEQVCYKVELTRQQVIQTCEYLNSKWDCYPPRECDIFCVAGQSNAVGFGPQGVVPVSYKSNGTNGGYIVNYQNDTAYETPITCFKPTSSGISNFTIPSQLTGTTNVNIAPATSSCSMYANFGDEYYKNTGRIAVFIYTGRPGSGMISGAQWNPYTYSTTPVNYWNDVKNSLPIAINKLTTNGWKVLGKYLLWNQGENTGDKNNPNYIDYLRTARDIVLNDFGYDKFFYYVIANDDLTAEGFNYTQQVQLSYTFTQPEDANFHQAFNCNIFNNLGLMFDASHYRVAGYSMAGSESGKQVASIVNKLNTLSLRDVNSVLKDPPVYEPTNVKYWGAVGDGIADDTFAIQTAINNNTSCVYFPAGVYSIIGANLQVANKTNFTITGDGATILREQTGTPNNITLRLNACSFTTISNLYILQTNQGLGGNNSCLELNNSFGCIVRDCYFGGTSSSALGNVVGINIITDTGNDYLTFPNLFENNYLVRCQWAMRIRSFSVNQVIKNCVFSYNSLNSILFQNNSSRVDIDGCKFSASNVAIRIDGIGKGAITEGDRITIKNSSFNNISTCGIYANNIKYGVSIIGCDFSVNGDNLGFGWTWGANNTAPSNLPANSKWGIFIQGGVNMCMSSNTFQGCQYGIGWNGLENSNISSNIFVNNITQHIFENRTKTGTAPNNYSSNQIIIDNNSFAGLGTSTAGSRPITFNTSVSGDYTYNIKTKNNSTTTGLNSLYFNSSLPNGTYLIDPLYEEITIDLATSNATHTLNITPAMFGKSFTIVAINSATADINQRDILFTSNYTGSETPKILGGGIQYNSVSKSFKITSTGIFTFTSNTGGINDWTITCQSNPVLSTNILDQTISVTPGNIDYQNVIDNVGKTATITFGSNSSWNAESVGYEFFFWGDDDGATPSSQINIVNNTGTNIRILFKAGYSNLGNGFTSNLTGNLLRHMYKAVYTFKGGATPSWYIFQL